MSMAREFVSRFLVQTLAGFSLVTSLGVLADDAPPTPQEMVGYGLYVAGEASHGDSKSLAQLQSNAAAQDAGAQFGLGDYYWLNKDYPQAVSWFQQSADQNFSGGYYALGVAYDSGLGVPLDHAQAMRMYLKAAAEIPSAATNIALLYAQGCGVDQDYAQAANWYRKAADSDFEAALDLAALYVKGQGVPQDDAQAMHWYRKAADSGNALAQYRLGLLYEESRSLQDSVQAAHWYDKAGQQGVADAQVKLGILYSDGKGVSKDPARAVNWFQMSANQGNGQAQFRLAMSFKNGEGVKPDPFLAYQWMTITKMSLHENDPTYLIASKDLQDWEQQMSPTQIKLASKAASQWLQDRASKKGQPLPLQLLRPTPCASPKTGKE